MTDPWTIAIWSIGVVAMAAASWLQDRRDIRREEGALTKFQRDIEKRLEKVEVVVAQDHLELKKLKVKLRGDDD